MARVSKKNFFTFMSTPEFKQNWFDLSHPNSGSCNMGQLVPVLVEPTLPGDYFTCNLSYLIRMAQMVAPPMSRIGVSFFPFYCPNRILMDSKQWDKFLSDIDGTSGVSLPTLSWSVISNVITSDLDSRFPYLDSLDKRDFVEFLNSDSNFIEGLKSILKVAASSEIESVRVISTEMYNEFYFEYTDSSSSVNSFDPSGDEAAVFGKYGHMTLTDILQYLFSKFLGSSPFVGSLLDYLGFPVNSPAMTYQPYIKVDLSNSYYNFSRQEVISPIDSIQVLPIIAYLYIWNEFFRQEYIQEEIPADLLDDFNSWKNLINADMSILWKLKRRDWEHDYFTSALPSPQLGEASSIEIGSDGKFTIPELREGNVVQRIREKLLHGGSRVWEILSNFFNERVSDSRLQLPEYIRPNDETGFSWLRISDIYQTAPGASDSFPTLEADANIAAPRGASANVNRVGLSFNFKAEEHGYIIVLMNIQPEAVYSQGLPKHYTYLDTLDYGWPDFANLTEQPVYDFEVFATPANLRKGTTNDYPIFGYQSQYAAYKFHQGEYHGELRDDLDFFHFGRMFASTPNLNSEFLECNPTDRPFPISYEYDKITYHLAFDFKVNRRLPYFGIPSLR